MAETQDDVAKTHGSGDWFHAWLCARKYRCRFGFWHCEKTRGKIVWRKNVEYSSSFVFLSFWTACAYPKMKQQQKIRFRRRLAVFEQKKAPVLGYKLVRFWGNQPPTLRKSATDFGSIDHRFWGNLPRISGKCSTDFGENLQTLGKSVTDFGKISRRFWGKIRHRFWGNLLLEKQALFLGQAGLVFGRKPFPSLGKQALWFGTAVFGTKWCGLGENWLGFWIGLDKAQVSVF